MVKSEAVGRPVWALRSPVRFGLLFASFVCSGPLLIGVLYVLWQQSGRIEDAFRIANHQLEISRRVLSVVERLGRASEAERRSMVGFAAEFETSLDRLEESVAATRRLPPGTSTLSESLSTMRQMWDQVESPLLSAAKSGSSQPQSSRQLQSQMTELVETGSRVISDIDSRKQSLQRWLLGAFAATAIFCLFLLYTGVALVQRGTARVTRMIDSLAERNQAAGLLATGPRAPAAALPNLPEPISGISASVNRLVTLVERTCRRNETLVNGVPAGIIVLSEDLRVLDANKAFLKMRQTESRHVVGRSLTEVLPSTLLAKWATQVVDLGASPESVSFALDAAGSVQHLRAILTPVKPEDDPAVRLLLILEDETELNLLRSARQEFEQRYRELLHNVSEAVLLVGPNGVIHDLNVAAERLFGWTRDEAISKPLALLMPEDVPTAPEHRLISLLSSGKWRLHETTVECEFLRREGSGFPSEVRIGFCRTGSADFYLLTIRDVSDCRRAELFARDRLEVIELIARNRPLETVFTSLGQMLEHQVPGSMCFVMLRRGDQLYSAAAPSLPEPYVRAVNGMPIGPSVASCGTAAFEGKVVPVSDIAADPLWDDYRDLALRHDLRSSWSIPVYSSDGLIVGTIALYFREPRQPDSSQLELLQMASRLAAVAIEQRELTGRLAYQAQHDALTGLPNRLCFEERMKHAIVAARRRNAPLGLLSVDMDRFKLVNDTLGHGAGDGLLQEVANRIKTSVRETDIVARWGGDEFVVGLTEIAHPEDISLVAQKLLDAFKHPVAVEGHDLFITATIGASVYPNDGQDLAELVRNADRAMYRAKNQGRNNFKCYAPKDGEAAGQRLELEFELRRALENGELALDYQPQFRLSDCKLVGLEALLRWNHPRLGVVSPTRFVPIAEETGLIVPIGSWALEQVCRQAGEWQKAGCSPIRVAVNVSTLQFGRPNFVDMVSDTLVRFDLDPSLLELEMTESLVMRNLEESTLRMHKLRNLGVRIAIDDFGTGYSSLSYLQRLPIDSLKIDQSFVRDLSSTSSTLPLVQSIVSLARSLGMSATAEGVETQSQLDALRETGCHLVQGFFLAKPLSTDRVLPMMFNGRRRTMFMVTTPRAKDDKASRRRRPSLTAPGVRSTITPASGQLSVL